MRSTGIVAAVGGVVALVGFAGAANASATIDLIWADTGTNQISNVNTSSAITLSVILTAGPNGSAGAGVSVDYSDALNTLSVIGYASNPNPNLSFPHTVGDAVDSGTHINNLSAACFLNFCNGLMAGESHQLGTVQFHNSGVVGTFELLSVIVGTDGVLDLSSNLITDTTTFNSAFLINVAPEPDFDADGVGDTLDNCSQAANPAQDDTDADGCGNLCDADYDNNGIVGFSDWGAFSHNFGTTNELYKHVEPIPGEIVGFADFGFFSQNFGKVPGPSGTTAGTTACP